MDYIEILDICAYDVSESSKIVDICTKDVIEEVLNQIGLETIQPKSGEERPGGRLYGSRSGKST